MDPKIEAAIAVAEQDAEPDLIGSAARVLAAEVQRLEAVADGRLYSAAHSLLETYLSDCSPFEREQSLASLAAFTGHGHWFKRSTDEENESESL